PRARSGRSRAAGAGGSGRTSPHRGASGNGIVKSSSTGGLRSCAPHPVAAKQRIRIPVGPTSRRKKLLKRGGATHSTNSEMYLWNVRPLGSTPTNHPRAFVRRIGGAAAPRVGVAPIRAAMYALACSGGIANRRERKASLRL